MQRFPETKEFFKAWETDHFVHTTARASEMMGAVGLVQLDKMDPQLDMTRALKKQFLSKLVSSPLFSLQHVDDPEGDCGISVTLILTNADHVPRFLSLISSSQIMARPIFAPKIRDSSVYYWWDSILEKKSHHPTGYPWKDPAYKGSVEYSKDMCSKSLDILGRAITLSFSIKMTAEHVDYMVDAVNKAFQTLSQ
jgi:8-amino-3,8-dideoxy-alpha-D-manno-octulosonate transaminase